jgi:GNAT superfamily N-acetyltransferase
LYYFDGEKMGTEFRYATESDVALILDFISRLAEYEKMSDEMIADEELLCEWIFKRKSAEVIFALEDGKEVGFALFFHNFSTFLGRAGIYLEDLFVLPEYRGRGHGKALITELARITVERGCGKLEWCCLDWNKPSIDFYLSLGARQMSEWTTYRLAGDSLKSLVNDN